MARVRGVYLREPPKGPSAYTSKEAALSANPTMLVADAAFPKDRPESVKNAAFRVNSGGRGEWSNSEYFAVWEYAKDVVLRTKGSSGDDADDSRADGAVEVIGFVQEEEASEDETEEPDEGETEEASEGETEESDEGETEEPDEGKKRRRRRRKKKKVSPNVIGEGNEVVGKLEDLVKEEGVETGGWVLLIGLQPNVPEGWEKTVNAPGSRKRKRRDDAGE